MVEGSIGSCTPIIRTPCHSANFEALGQKGPGDTEWGWNKILPPSLPGNTPRMDREEDSWRGA